MNINTTMHLFVPKLLPVTHDFNLLEESCKIKTCTIIVLSISSILEVIKHLLEDECEVSLIVDKELYNDNHNFFEKIKLYDIKLFIFKKEKLSQLKQTLVELQETNFYLLINGEDLLEKSIESIITDYVYFIFDLLKSFISLRYNKDHINIFVSFEVSEYLEKTYINGLLSSYFGLAQCLNEEQKKIRFIPLKVKKSTHKDIINYIKNKININKKDSQYSFDEQLIEGIVYEKKWVSTNNTGNWESRIKNNSTLWIVGGLGGVGIKIIQYLLNTYQNLNIIITGRTPKSIQISKKLDNLCKNGSHISYYSVDVCISEEIEIFIKKLSNRNILFNGVVYCAGVNQDSLLNFKTKEQIKNVLTPKIIGLLNVDNVTSSQPLDFFISLSSIVSLIGNVGQTDYGFANAFVDSFAEYREKLNRPGVSLTVNLGLIDTGMGNDKKVIEQFQKRNIYPLDGMQVPGYIHKALGIGGEVAITTPNEIFNINSNENNTIINMNRSAIPLKNNDSEKIIKECLSRELELPMLSLENDSDFSSLGVDSIMIMNMVEYLSGYCTEPLDHSLLIENSTINKLSKAIVPYLIKPSQNSDSQLLENEKESYNIKDKSTTIQDDYPKQIIKECLSRELELPMLSLENDSDFSSLGVDSIMIMNMVEYLSGYCTEPLDHSLLIENSTINKLSKAIVPYLIKPSQNSDNQLLENEKESYNIKDKSTTIQDDYLKQIIKECLSRELELPMLSLENDSDFSSLGVDSIMIMNMVEYLSGYCTEPLDHSLLIENSTINKLSKAIMPCLKIQENLNIEINKDTFSYENEEHKDIKTHSNFSSPVNTEDIAIIGIAGKFPGSETIEEYYDNLKKGVFSIKEFPKERINPSNYDDFFNKNKVYTHKAGTINYTKFLKQEYLENGEDLDYVDPQQLLFMDTVQELLKEMNYTKEEIKGKKISVFVGGHEIDYYKKKGLNNKYSGKHGITNVISNMIPARISHYFDLKGTSEMVYTACSSSLVALKNACNSLLLNDSEMAIVGGVELLIDEQWFIGFCDSGVLAKDGKCKAFDKEADGFVLGEGVGAVAIKKYSEAIKAGDDIWAVIKGISINNDGHTLGLTTPNRFIQEELIQNTLDISKVDPSTIGCYEAHGTATQLGDPIEIKAVTNVYKKYTSNKSYCGLGSVKTNIGHLLSAAGIASVIKLALSIRYGYLFPTLNCEKHNPKLDIDNSPFFIVEECQPWKMESPRRGAISSFGFGGTNCHLIIEEFIPPAFYKNSRKSDKEERNVINHPVDKNMEQLLLSLIENKININTFLNKIQNENIKN